jgi:hypothetical protein
MCQIVFIYFIHLLGPMKTASFQKFILLPPSNGRKTKVYAAGTPGRARLVAQQFWCFQSVTDFRCSICERRLLTPAYNCAKQVARTNNELKHKKQYNCSRVMRRHSLNIPFIQVFRKGKACGKSLSSINLVFSATFVVNIFAPTPRAAQCTLLSFDFSQN